MELSYLYVVSTIFIAMIIVFALSIVVQYVSKFKSFILYSLGNKASVSKLKIVEKNSEHKKGNGPLDDLEIVAVITAALSSYLDVPQASLNIKNIKKVDNNCE